MSGVDVIQVNATVDDTAAGDVVVCDDIFIDVWINYPTCSVHLTAAMKSDDTKRMEGRFASRRRRNKRVELFCLNCSLTSGQHIRLPINNDGRTQEYSKSGVSNRRDDGKTPSKTELVTAYTRKSWTRSRDSSFDS